MLWRRERVLRMKTKALIVSFVIFFSGFFYHSPALSKWVDHSSEPIVKKIGHNRTKHHGIFTVLSYLLINSFDKDPYLTASDVVESDDDRIQTLAARLSEDKVTDMDKSRAIYSWITKNIEYDANYYYQIRHQTDFEFDSALETLQNRKTLCMGYSHLNAALHRAIGIEAKVVYDEEHAWNEVLLDGNWYSQDTTKGAGYIDTDRKEFISAPTMDYFAMALIFKKGQYLW
jgi:transglutaminase-like putative cysteine protease